MRIAPLAMLLVACGRGDVKTVDSATAGAESSASAVSLADSVTRNPSSVAPCRPTGSWEPCHVFDRLDRAGLAPRRDTTITATSEPPLTPKGTQLLVGSAKLQLYVYPDIRTREREQGKLDRAKYVSFDAPLMMGAEHTLISNTNLIAILQSRNDHLRERVADAITAGPPQPPSAQPKPTP